MKYFLGFDIGSSSVKAALLEAESGLPIANCFSPESEMQILSPQSGFAEQDPELWWKELKNALNKLRALHFFRSEEIISIGISYQMHGLVCIDKSHKALRPAIIWCDSRAVDIGNIAFDDLGHSYCLSQLLNSPGNFTASKLKWVKDNEPNLFNRIYKILLPGDFIALKMTGVPSTTITGLSEGIFWNYAERNIAASLLDYYGIPTEMISDIVPIFGEQGKLKPDAATELGLAAGTPVCYRAGDQPNNAWSLQVQEPGEIAATAGTSGVIYGITDKILYDDASRVNSFVHVNHTDANPRYGVLLCVNGTGILNSWVQKNFFDGLAYSEINRLASLIPVGSEGLSILPFGNGAERILSNRDPGCALQGLEFNRHHRGHVARAAQEGIAFALNYGWDIMREMGMQLSTVKAGQANMFLSDIFAGSFCNLTNCRLEFYNTDGAYGAARGAGLGSGFYKNPKEAFRGMKLIKSMEPDISGRERLMEVYTSWKNNLLSYIQ
jgi:xylulokinase